MTMRTEARKHIEITIKIEKAMGALFCWYVKKSYVELIEVAQLD